MRRPGDSTINSLKLNLDSLKEFYSQITQNLFLLGYEYSRDDDLRQRIGIGVIPL